MLFIDFLVSKNRSLELRTQDHSNTSSESKNMIAFRYLADILDLCKFNLFPPGGSLGTLNVWCSGDLKEIFGEKKNYVAILSQIW